VVSVFRWVSIKDGGLALENLEEGIRMRFWLELLCGVFIFSVVMALFLWGVHLVVGLIDSIKKLERTKDDGETD